MSVPPRRFPPVPQLSALRAAVTAFTASPSSFRILYTIPPSRTPSSAPPPSSPCPKPLYILDSSFNPPTTAHLQMAISALRSTPQQEQLQQRTYHHHHHHHHLLLLLALQNADKARATPATSEHRLAMMILLATEIASRETGVRVDVGLTSEAYFHAKARAITASGAYGNAAAAATTAEPTEPAEQQLQQVHLMGFDTLVRLLDTKYYSPTNTLKPLEGFFDTASVRVTRRAGGKWGNKWAQDGGLGRAEWVQRGGRAEWAGKVELVDAEAGQGVSSTRVREAVGRGDGEGWEGLVVEGVRRWILEERLYVGEGEKCIGNGEGG